MSTKDKDRKSLMKQYDKWWWIAFVFTWLFFFTVTASIIALIDVVFILILGIVNNLPVTIEQFFYSWRSTLGTLFCLIGIYPFYRMSSYAKGKLKKYRSELSDD